jgi:hypothetical protein
LITLPSVEGSFPCDFAEYAEAKNASVIWQACAFFNGDSPSLAIFYHKIFGLSSPKMEICGLFLSILSRQIIVLISIFGLSLKTASLTNE